MEKTKEMYVCDACHQTYEKGWSDDEADLEAKELHGKTSKDEDIAIVCDDCFNAMRKQNLF